MQTPDIDRALNLLPVQNTFRDGEWNIEIAFLVREADWRPLKASWWRGKEACLIGADLAGNFFLRHCDGTVRYWNHQLNSDVILARSVKDFVKRIAQ